MPSWYYIPMEIFGKKGDCCQAITPQSNMGLSYKTLLIAILKMVYIKSGIHICDSHPLLDSSVKRQSYAGNKEIIHYDTWANNTRHLGWLSLEMCSQIIVLQATDWFATDWARQPGIRWPAPNGTHWTCGTNLWPWLPPGWIGHCTLGFAWIHGRITKTITTPANLPNLKQRWMHSVFKWYDHLASIFVPSVGLEDVMYHVDALNKYTTKALNDSLNSISLLNTEISQIRQGSPTK